VAHRGSDIRLQEFVEFGELGIGVGECAAQAAFSDDEDPPSEPCSSAMFRASRSTFSPNFLSQNSRRVAGVVV
jgi:hypothetical protein